MTITEEEMQEIRDLVESEGFGYAMDNYIGEGISDDPEYLRLYKAYIKASDEFCSYVELER